MVETDISQVAAIESVVFSDPWSAGSFLAALRLPDNLYLTALQGEEIVGYCGLYRSFEEGEIVNVAVHPAHRRKGIAVGMLHFLLEEGRREGITRYLLEVRVSNAGAIALYRELGFVQLGIRRDFYTLPREDALIMCLEGIA